MTIHFFSNKINLVKKVLRNEKVDRFEFEFLKSMILGKDDLNYENVSSIYEMLKSKFGFAIFDAFEIFKKCPELCTASASSIEKNLSDLEKSFSLGSRQFRFLVLKFPFVLLLNNVLLEYKINLLSTVFAVSKSEALDKMLVVPNLLFISKVEIKNATAMLAELLDEFGEGVRRLVRTCPFLLFSKREHIKALKKIMFYDFSFSEKQTLIIFKTCPDLMLKTEQELKNIYEFYYPRYFVKRDFKEMVPICPEFMTMPFSLFSERLKVLQNSLGTSEKEALSFARKCPNILLYNPKTKIDGFKKFGINLEFLKIHPNICVSHEFSIPLKFVLARILGLESEFEKLCEVDTRTIISRFLFMQSKKIYTHEDLLLSEEEFFKKYHVTSHVLKICYIVSDGDLQKICKYYVDLKGKLPMWSDIVFPEVKDVERFLKEKLCESYSCPMFEVLHEKYLLSKKQYDVIVTLRSLYLDKDECIYLLSKCNDFATCGAKNIINSVNFFRKQGFSLEEIIHLLLTKPTLFTYFISDLDELYKNTIAFYNCSAKDAVSYIC